MKRLLLTLIMLASFVGAFAKKEYAEFSIHKSNITIDRYWYISKIGSDSEEPMTLKDKDGINIKFNSYIDALNYLSKEKYEIVEVLCSITEPGKYSQNVKQIVILMSIETE